MDSIKILKQANQIYVKKKRYVHGNSALVILFQKCRGYFSKVFPIQLHPRNSNYDSFIIHVMNYSKITRSSLLFDIMRFVSYFF